MDGNMIQPDHPPRARPSRIFNHLTANVSLENRGILKNYDLVCIFSNGQKKKKKRIYVRVKIL